MRLHVKVSFYYPRFIPAPELPGSRFAPSIPKRRISSLKCATKAPPRDQAFALCVEFGGTMMKVWLTVLVFLFSSLGFAENVDTEQKRSQKHARQIVDAAVQALGGAESLQNLENVVFNNTAETYGRLQMPTWKEPFTPGTLKESVLVDLKNDRLMAETEGKGPAGFDFNNRVVVKGGEGQILDLRARTATSTH